MDPIRQVTFLAHNQETELTSQVAAAIRDNLDHDKFSGVTNLSIIYYAGKLCFSGLALPNRKSEQKSLMAFVYANGRLINLTSHTGGLRVEDPKLVSLRGSLFVTFHAGASADYNAYVCEVLPNLGKIRRLIVTGRLRAEKNWGFYEQGGKIFALYSASPSRVLALEEETETEWRMQPADGSLTGYDPEYSVGTPPALHLSGRRYLVVHQKRDAGQRMTYYAPKLAMFNPATGEIKVDHQTVYAHTPDTLLGKHKHGKNRVRSCTYFAGMVIEKGRVLVSYGINDYDWGIASLPLSVLNPDNFEPIPRPKAVMRPTRPKPVRKVNSRTVVLGKDELPPPTPPGEQFHQLLVKKYGIKPCARCLVIISMMNSIGVDGCREQKTNIIADIWDRRDQLKGWKAIAAKLPGSSVLAKRELGKLFDQAVDQAETEEANGKQNPTDPNS